MDLVKGKKKKTGLIIKTWERCRCFSDGGSEDSSGFVRKSQQRPLLATPPENKKLQGKGGRKRRVAPEGCFSVCVGPEKQRFVIKTEYVNHPLFRVLLEEAELEYGYNSEGPLALPCNVDVFIKVLLEMDSDGETSQGCNSFGRSYSSYQLLSPSELVALNEF
ncbi:hypothetical protein RJ639_032982 [Escallonia herrerae]|uniref:Small auxin up regulated protein n=1 Tax=Escallonia herrerae TaxID=1293975 RepID=A0AA88X531_9ASTE|nr:hypothetical protein RJ639_032982 [Escallonia herrerae]